MHDLEQNLRQWRQELEATLAFSIEEIEELEDHLRLSTEARLKEGLPAESAWTQSLIDLGSASSLAIEFAKDKLMPALCRLFIAWVRPGCLLALFSAIVSYSFTIQPLLASPATSPAGLAVRTPLFWGLVSLALLVTLVFLPQKAQKNALLVGIGNAFCLIPILHVLFYNSLTEKIIGPGWRGMAASFGEPIICLSVSVLMVLNIWGWKRCSAEGAKHPQQAAIVGLLILMLTLSPFVGELIGNFSIRNLYELPTASQVNFTGETLHQFLIWKFVDVLQKSLLYIVNILPFALTCVISTEILVSRIFFYTKSTQASSPNEIFPAPSSLPWMMTLAASGSCWVLAHWAEPPFSRQFQNTASNTSATIPFFGGLEIAVLLCACLFLICGFELTKQLARASQIRAFYACALVIMDFAVILGLLLLPLLSNMDPAENFPSVQPEWLSVMLGLALASLAAIQIFFIVKKSRRNPGPASLWRFDGKNLVELGLLFGLIIAGSWLTFIMIATVLAFESTSVIQAMIAWGNSIKNPGQEHFYPQIYGTPDHLAFWVASGIVYLSFCLAAGLATTIVLSGLEFIRFNGFRLYKLRKIKHRLEATLAINE